jgi:hypothetical protein
MTTVAYKDGWMACDSAWSDERQVLTRRPKIIRLASGGLLGEAGACDTRAIVSLFDKVKKPTQLPPRKELVDMKIDYSGLLVLPSGKIFHVFMDEPEEDRDGPWDGGVYDISERFFAVGSGRSYALAIMEDGGTARRAVEIACRRDSASRTPVHVMRLPILAGKNGKP